MLILGDEKQLLLSMLKKCLTNRFILNIFAAMDYFGEVPEKNTEIHSM